MLGCLRMSIDQCEEAYLQLSEEIFTPRRANANVLGKTYDFLNADGKFSTQSLEVNIKRLIQEAGLEENEKFDDRRADSCKVFVSVVRGHDSANTVLRSYMNPHMQSSSSVARYCRIWEAARAKSAASTFFEPIAIGPHGQTFVDGALRFNNPIRLLDRESQDLWPDSNRIFLSIGTGSAPGGSLEGNLWTLAKRLKEIVLESEKTADDFLRDNQALASEHRYYRFNVIYGLEHVGLEEYKARSKIYAVTDTYLENMETVSKAKQYIATVALNTPTAVTKGYAGASSAYTLTEQPRADLASRVGPRIPAPANKPVAPTASSFQARKQQAMLNKQLIQAVGDDDATEVAKLLAMGADANAGCEINLPGLGLAESDSPPIYAAAYLKRNEIVQLLIRHGADVNAAGGWCGPALTAAIAAGNAEGVEYLLEASAEVNAKGGVNGTAVQQAVLLNYTGILKTLLSAGADVNAQTPPYGSALACAAVRYSVPSIRILVDAGADMSTLAASHRQAVKSIISSR